MSAGSFTLRAFERAFYRIYVVTICDTVKVRLRDESREVPTAVRESRHRASERAMTRGAQKCHELAESKFSDRGPFMGTRSSTMVIDRPQA